MRVAVYHNNRDVRLEEYPRPTLGNGEVLLQVEASGVCGSDVMEWYRVPKAPLVLGHEVAGTVAEVGEGVTHLRPGDRIVATHHVPCHQCHYCRSDRHSVCETLRTTHFEPGGFAEYVRLPAINVTYGVLPLPEGVSSEEGSFVEPLACVVRAQRLARVGEGQTVLVLGSGISGVLHIQLARARGAEKILATDVSEYRREAAGRFGADLAIPADEDVPKAVRSGNQGRLADLVLVCTGARSALEQAFQCVDRGGTILFFAPAHPETTFPLALFPLWRDGITLLHSYAGPPADMREALKLIVEKRVDVASMVTHRLGLSETGEGFQLVCQGGASLKVIIDPRR